MSKTSQEMFKERVRMISFSILNIVLSICHESNMLHMNKDKNHRNKQENPKTVSNLFGKLHW